MVQGKWVLHLYNYTTCRTREGNINVTWGVCVYGLGLQIGIRLFYVLRNGVSSFQGWGVIFRVGKLLYVCTEWNLHKDINILLVCYVMLCSDTFCLDTN